jgi:hypothetical protein
MVDLELRDAKGLERRDLLANPSNEPPPSLFVYVDDRDAIRRPPITDLR